MLNVISNRVKTSFRDIIMEDKHARKYETKKNELVSKAQDPTGSSTKVKLALEIMSEVGTDVYQYHTLIWTKLYQCTPHLQTI